VFFNKIKDSSTPTVLLYKMPYMCHRYTCGYYCWTTLWFLCL